MRILFLLLNLLFVSCLYARNKDTTTYRFRVQASCFYSMPQGQFSATHSDLFYAGQCKNSPGFGFLLFSFNPVYNFDIGINVSVTDYLIDEHKFVDQIKKRYSLTGYYNQFDINIHRFSLTSFSLLECGYFFNIHFIEIEPYFELGWGSANGFNNSIVIH